VKAEFPIIAERRMPNRLVVGKVDIEVGVAAKSEDRMIFTLDLDFADLRKFPPGAHPGVMLFRPCSRYAPVKA
jgi:predicted nuclease of predicted toxin-antitoxin system